MKCQNCGRELKNGARFCIGCGAQHDENGQLIGGKSNHIDYNKTMMAGSTGFQQYQPEQNQQVNQQFNEYNYNSNSNENVNFNRTNKKKLSPIIIICPIIIVAAIVFSIFNGKNNKINSKKTEQTTTTIATVPEVKKEDEREVIHLKGYWSADAEYFYIDGEMQTNKWVEDYYVGQDGKKVTNKWIDEKYYVDSTGKMARNEWIEFPFYGEDGRKKTGFYYVGDDGKKVYNKTIDGRYINEEGCYWPQDGDSIQNEEKRTNKIDIEADESVKNETNNKNESTKAIEATKQESSTVAQTTIAQVNISETQANIIAPTEKKVSSVASDGNTISYQTVTETFPDEKITKYVSVIVNDQKYPNLILGINEWNANRDHSGIKSGEAMLDSNITVTYDVNVERNDNNIFSLCELKTKYDNNKAYEKIKKGYVWDTNSGQQLSLESIFNGENRYGEFAKKVLEKIKSNKSSFDTDTYEEVINSDPEDILSGCEWYMTNTGIVLSFGNEHTGSEKVEPFTITLTYSDAGNGVNKLLLTKYKKS